MNMSSMSLTLIHTSVSPAVWLSTGAQIDMACSGNVKVYMTARASDETRPVTLSLSYPNGSDRPALHQDFHVFARFQSIYMSCCPTGRKVSSLENRYWTPTTSNCQSEPLFWLSAGCQSVTCNCSAAVTILSKLPPKSVFHQSPTSHFYAVTSCWAHHSWQWRRWPWQSYLSTQVGSFSISNVMCCPKEQLCVWCTPDVICPPGCQGTLLTHAEPGVDQHPQIPLCRDAPQTRLSICICA